MKGADFIANSDHKGPSSVCDREQQPSISYSGQHAKTEIQKLKKQNMDVSIHPKVGSKLR